MIVEIRRVLPAVHVICVWLSTPAVNDIYRSMPSLSSIESTRLSQIEIWSLLANVCNWLNNALDTNDKGNAHITVNQTNI
jgi:hypothetical protein